MGPRTKHRCLKSVLGVTCLVLGGGQLWAGESPWYVAARFGESRAETQFGARHAKHIDDQASSAAIDLGYELNRYLAVEAGYEDLGRHAGWGSPCLQSDDACIERLAAFDLCVEGFECTEVLAALDAEISGFSLALVPRWPLGERLSLRAKLGVIAWDGDVTAVGFGVHERFSGEELITGIGLQYDLPGGLGVRMQHDELDLGTGTTSVGVSWRF